MTEGRTDTFIYAYEPYRLASPLPVTFEGLPKWIDLGLQDLASEALEWYHQRNSLAFTEIRATYLPYQRDRWTELAGLAGSISETVFVACAAEVEAALIAKEIEEKDLPSAFGMSRRAFGEMEGTFVISATHRLANWSARALMLAKAYPWDWLDAEVATHSLPRLLRGEAALDIRQTGYRRCRYRRPWRRRWDNADGRETQRMADLQRME